MDSNEARKQSAIYLSEHWDHFHKAKIETAGNQSKKKISKCKYLCKNCRGVKLIVWIELGLLEIRNLNSTGNKQ